MTRIKYEMLPCQAVSPSVFKTRYQSLHALPHMWPLLTCWRHMFMSPLRGSAPGRPWSGGQPASHSTGAGDKALGYWRKAGVGQVICKTAAPHQPHPALLLNLHQARLQIILNSSVILTSWALLEDFTFKLILARFSPDGHGCKEGPCRLSLGRSWLKWAFNCGIALLRVINKLVVF